MTKSVHHFEKIKALLRGARIRKGLDLIEGIIDDQDNYDMCAKSKREIRDIISIARNG